MLIRMPSLLPCTPYLLSYISYLCFPDFLADCFRIDLQLPPIFVLSYFRTCHPYLFPYFRHIFFNMVFQIWPFPIFSPYCIVLLFSTYVYSLVFPLVSSLVFFLSSSHSKLPFFCMFFFPIWFPIFFSLSFHPFATRGEIGNMAMATCTLGWNGTVWH